MPYIYKLTYFIILINLKIFNEVSMSYIDNIIASFEFGTIKIGGGNGCYFWLYFLLSMQA